MQKTLRHVLAVVLSAVVLLVVGCGGSGGGDAPFAVAGTWDFVSAVVSAPLLPGDTIEVTPSLLGVLGFPFSLTIIFEDDRTFAVSADVPAIPGVTGGGDWVIEGTVAVSGGDLTLTVTSATGGDAATLITPGTTITASFVLEDDTLTLGPDPDDTPFGMTVESAVFNRRV